MVHHRRRISLTLMLLIALLVSAPVAKIRPVAAQNAAAPGFGMKAEPGADVAITVSGYFVYQAKPGTALTGKLRLTNPTKQAITVSLAAVDAIDANNGGSAFATDESAPSSIGTWLALKKTTITVKPGKDQLAAFTARVPKDAKPGQFLAGLSAAVNRAPASATPAAQAAGQAGAAIDLRTRYVIAVEIDVAGAWTPSLRITGVKLLHQPSGLFLGIGLENDGATFLHPSGTLTMTDANGKAVLTQDIKLGTFVTGTAIVYPTAWPDALSAGVYHATVKLTYGDGLTAVFDGNVEVD